MNHFKPFHMKTLQEIKHEFALEFGFKNWNELTEASSKPMLQNHMNDIARRYAKQCVKASLEKAAHAIHDVDIFTISFTARERSAITSPENITLL